MSKQKEIYFNKPDCDYINVQDVKIGRRLMLTNFMVIIEVAFLHKLRLTDSTSVWLTFIEYSCIRLLCTLNLSKHYSIIVHFVLRHRMRFVIGCLKIKQIPVYTANVCICADSCWIIQFIEYFVVLVFVLKSIHIVIIFIIGYVSVLDNWNSRMSY